MEHQKKRDSTRNKCTVEWRTTTRVVQLNLKRAYLKKGLEWIYFHSRDSRLTTKIQKWKMKRTEKELGITVPVEWRTTTRVVLSNWTKKGHICRKGGSDWSSSSSSDSDSEPEDEESAQMTKALRMWRNNIMKPITTGWGGTQFKEKKEIQKLKEELRLSQQNAGQLYIQLNKQKCVQEKPRSIAPETSAENIVASVAAKLLKTGCKLLQQKVSKDSFDIMTSQEEATDQIWMQQQSGY
jgi:hypothetical protein